jgi:hypothetical protein
VLSADLAQKVRAAFLADLKRGRQESNLRIDRLGWAIRHLDVVVARAAKPRPIPGGGLWGDLGGTGDVEL